MISNIDDENITDLTEYENLSPKELKSRAIKELNIDEKYLNSENEKESLFSKKTLDSMANLEFFAEKLENTLRGKTLIKTSADEEVYKQTGKALVGESFIKQASSIIKTFGNKAMLLSGKNEKDFFMQFEDAFFTISDMVLERKHNFSVIAVRGILKEIKDTFWNIGDVLLKTGTNMQTYFGKLGEMSEEVNNKLGSNLDG